MSLIVASLPFAITACGRHGVVGTGTGPDHLVVSSSSAVAGATYFDMYECIRSSVRAVLVFKDGSSGDYTSRVIWSSSSPGTVTISNGDQPTPAGSLTPFYPHGTVTPIAGGSAVITASYFGLQASIGVNVGTPQSLTVKRLIQGNQVLPPALPASQVRNSGNSLTSTGFTMGIGTTETLTVVAQLDGKEENIQTTGVDWHFLLPNDQEASLNSSTGVLTGLVAGAPLVAVVGFDSCTYTASTQVTVAGVNSIFLSPEFPGDPSATPPVPQPQLVVGNTEKVNVYANLSDGTVQDISNQAQLASSDTTVLSFVAFGSGGFGNIATASTNGGPVNISASFTQGGSQLLLASGLQITTILSTLESIKIAVLPRPPNNLVTPTPADTVPPNCATATDFGDTLSANAIVVTGSTVPLQLCIQGSYNGGTLLQDITRQTSFVPSDPTFAVINPTGSLQTAGQAYAVGTQASTIQVTATPRSSSTTVAPLMFPLSIRN